MKTKNKKNVLKTTSWLVLASMFAPYGSALATPGLRESIQAEITAEYEKQYEQDTPGIGPSIPDKLLASSSKAIKENVIAMLTDFKMGVINGYNLAKDGNGTIVVIGAKEGWRLFKQYGEAAGIHYVDSVYLLPKKAVKIGNDFAKAGKNIADIAKSGAEGTAEAWKKAGGEIKKDAEEFRDTANVINDMASYGYRSAYHGVVEGVQDGANHAIEWSKDVWDWTKDNTVLGFNDLTQGTVDNVKMTGRWTKNTAKFFAEETAEAAKSVNYWSRAAWDWTYDTTSKTWQGTLDAGKNVYHWANSGGDDTAKWLHENTTAPFRQFVNGTKDFSKWNWKKGYTEGLKEGFRTAGDAWNHDDKLMATLWTISGIGKAGLHILLLEPTVVPLMATYGVAGTATLAAIGYPSVGAIYLGGLAATGITYAAGTAATGAVAVGGTAATLIAGGAGSVRTALTAGTGVVATVGAATVGTAYTVGAAGVNTLRTVGTPVVGAVGMTGAMVAGGAEIVGRTALGIAEGVGITALTATGYTLLSGYEAAKMTFSALQATGVTVFDNAIVTPLGVVTNLAQAIATGAWTLAEDPVYGTLDVLAAGGIAVGTIVTSSGAFTYELVKGILMGLGHGVIAVAQSGIWIVGAIGKGVEFVYSAFNIPQHHEWADFRKEEIANAFEAVKQEADPELSARFGEIILIRVHWWGENKGRVRFFITKNKQTGERWFFKRTVDPETCAIVYRVTNQDPVVRAFTNKPWAGAYPSGLFLKACEDSKKSN